jgi:hypothetical protein
MTKRRNVDRERYKLRHGKKRHVDTGKMTLGEVLAVANAASTLMEFESPAASSLS